MRDAVVVGVVLLATLAVLGKDITVGGPRFGDCGVHAMDGVLILDWVAAGPSAWLSPIEFAEQQYAHYPALGIGRHYPPGFAVVEATFLALFGVSAFSARLCVVFFGLLAAAGTYVFMRSFSDRATSALGAVILVTMPAVTQWGRQTMLEVPTLAVLIWAAVALGWYLRRPSWARLAVLLAVALLGLAFRQTGVFLVGAIGVTLTAWALTLPYGRVSVCGSVRPAHAMCTVAVALAAVTLAILTLDSHGAALLHGDGTGVLSWRVLSFYLLRIPGQVGVMVLLAAGIGLAVSRWKMGMLWVFPASWFIVCYTMVTLAAHKDARFFVVGLFPLAVWAALGVGSILSFLEDATTHFLRRTTSATGGGRYLASASSGLLRVGVCWSIGVGLVAVGLAAPVAHRPDYGPVVVANRNRIESHVVLFDGLRDGDFVFAVRQHIPWRKSIVIRGSKLLYSCSAQPEIEFVSYAPSPEKLAELMNQLAFEYVFVERENKLHLAEEAMLRGYLAKSGSYRRVASYPFQPEKDPSHRDVTIDVYESTGSLHRSVDHFDIPLPRIKRTIRVDLRGWAES